LEKPVIGKQAIFKSQIAGFGTAMVTEGVPRISVTDAKAKVKELAAQKDTLEGTISEITERLNTGPNPPGINGPLVDKQVGTS
jgi:hypothetical protein